MLHPPGMSGDATDRDPSASQAHPPGPLHDRLSPNSAAEILAFLQIVVEPGQVVELRALGVPCRGQSEPQVVAGCFDHEHLEEMARLAMRITVAGSGVRRSKGVYFSLNPVDPGLLKRMPNSVGVAGRATRDTDIVRRSLLMIDADPVRPTGISATEEEKEAARKATLAIRDHLRALGWPDPILVDSGNGFHLLYRVDLPADDDGLVRRVLSALGAIFSTDLVDIDQRVHNPSRIAKLPGTWARKGADTPERPHRLARVEERPDELLPVPRDMLEELAALAPGDRSGRGDAVKGPSRPVERPAVAGASGQVPIAPDSPIHRVLSQLGLTSSSGRTGAKWETCCPAHEDTKASLSIGLAEDGLVLIHCHAGCHWSAVVSALGLTPRDLFPAR